MSSHRNLHGGSSSEADLARLLARLAPDRERAAREYERLRCTLIRFFEWRGASPPEECADETLDRLAHKLVETAVNDLWNYAHGIARIVLLEWRRRPAMSPIDESEHPLRTEAESASDDGRLHDCLEQCLAELPAESRTLILRYYQGEGSEKISNRRRLAASLRVSENALRSRVQRVRDRLERCVRGRVSRVVR